MQIAVAELPLHWSLKLAFISAATIAIALLTYDFFVRSTFIGWVLNGRRRERVVWPRVLKVVRRNSIGEKCSVISSLRREKSVRDWSRRNENASADRSHRESLT